MIRPIIASLGARRRQAGSPPSIAHILITGQSLAIGANGYPILSTVQPYQNKMFVGGVRAPTDQLDSLVPLIAQIDVDVEGGFDGETFANSMADELTRRSLSSRFLVSNHAHSGYRYIQLKKGTTDYNRGMAQVQAGFDLLNGGDPTYAGVLAVCTAHGEQDQAFSTADYAGKLIEWQADYDADIKVITGQSTDVPLLVIQQCSASPFEASSPDVSTALESLRAHEESGGKVLLVGANYMYVRKDGIHLTANGYRSKGLMYARVLRRLIAGQSWEPIRPLVVHRTDDIIDVTFAVPSPPLEFDVERVYNPGNYGFTYLDDSNSAQISSVDIVAANKVRITLNAVPTGTNQTVRYGFRHGEWAGGGPKGPLSSPRGCLRDQGDGGGNAYGYQDFNWGVLFNKLVGFGEG